MVGPLFSSVATKGVVVIRRRRGSLPMARCLSSSSASSSDKKESRVETSIDTSTGIAHVQWNRPHKLNAVDLPMFEAMAATAADLRTDRSLRAVIMSGKGRAFCTGLDVKSALSKFPQSKTIERLLERPSGYGGYNGIGNLAQDVSVLWRELPVPVIAILHGMCFGAGMQIALGADFRLASPDCKLSIMETKWGLIPDMGISITLRELVRMDVAKELTMTGRIITAQEASSLGLVTRVITEISPGNKDDDDENKKKELNPLLWKAAEDLAKELIQRSPDALASAKELYHRTWLEPSDETCLKIETELQEKLLISWNQLAASGRAFGWNVPYSNRKENNNNDDKLKTPPK